MKTETWLGALEALGVLVGLTGVALISAPVALVLAGLLGVFAANTATPGRR